MEAQTCKRFDVRSVCAGQRLRYWEDVVARNTSPAAFRLEDEENFRSSLVQGAFERFTFSQVDSSALSAYRGKEHAKQSRGLFHLCLLVHGAAELCCHGQTKLAGEKSLTLYDEATPFRFRALSSVKTVAVGFPASLIMARLPSFRDILLRPLDATTGINQMLHSSLMAMDRLFSERHMKHFSYPVFLSLIDLLAASIDEATDCTTVQSTMSVWAGKVRAYVEAHLDDPDLSPASIASVFGISPRYLRLIFGEGRETTGGSETLRRYILRRRLEECANMLALPGAACGSITTLAYNWGFSDSSYFARRFVEYFGVTPRDFRTQKLREKKLESAMALNLS